MSNQSQTSLVSYPERFSRWIPLPYWLSIIISWQLLFLLDYVLGLNTPGAQEHLLEFGCLAVFFALVSSTIVYCSHVVKDLFGDILLFVDDEQSTLHAKLQSKWNKSYTGIGPLAAGLGFALLENFTVGPIIRQYSPAGSGVYYVRLVYELIGFFSLGLGIWALLQVMNIPILLLQYKIKVSINQIKGRGLQALGFAFFRMSISIIVTFVPLVVGVVFSPLTTNIIVLVWLLVGVLLIFAFFLLPQVGVHKIMLQEKRQRLVAFSGHLEEAMERSLAEPTSENMERLKGLFELQTHLKGMHEWPFDVNLLWQLITALLIPVLLAVIEIFF